MGEAKRRGNSGLGERRAPSLRGQIPPPGTFKIENPLVIMFADERGDVVCHIHPSERCPTHETYGLLIADLARHVARAFNVAEEDVWEWVDKERRRPTTAITNPS
jgi:hypothetical protein